VITTTIAIAFIFSFLGSIPPGTINLSVLQLSIENKYSAALRFCIAAAIIEFPYAWIAVSFQNYLMESPVIISNIKLIAALVMITLGIINLNAIKKSPGRILSKLQESGFRKGVLLSILNPLAIPFWIGVTAYLTSIGWVKLGTTKLIFWYVLGVSLGTFTLLFVVASLGKRLGGTLKHNRLTKGIPGVIFLCLGIYALFQFFNLV